MPFSHSRVFLIPLDSRPVCYDMPKRLAQAAGLALGMPTPNLLGQLKKPANFKTLSRWIKNHLFENDPIIVALDTIAYGGLIPSRVNEEPLVALQELVASFFSQIKADSCFGFSSILRIPNYNNQEEEPAYWAQYGKQLYDYSFQLHEAGVATEEGIPCHVLQDFLQRRQKNFALNQSYLDLLKDKTLSYLTFCQDDTGAFGLNVQEAHALAQEIEAHSFGEQAHIQTGADEVACCMLARWMALQQPNPIKIHPIYTSETGRKLVAKFDGLPIEQVVEKAIRACGAQLTEDAEASDLWVIVHTPDTHQGDHCGGAASRVHPDQVAFGLKTLNEAFAEGKKVSIADVAYANGGDPNWMAHFLNRFEDLTGLYGYAGWNTPGNTIGTAVAMGIIRLLAERNHSFNAEAFCKLLFIRFADDWLYQAEVRQVIRKNQAKAEKKLDTILLNSLMSDGLQLLKKRLGLEKETVSCSYPCKRTFEVEVHVSS